MHKEKCLSCYYNVLWENGQCSVSGAVETITPKHLLVCSAKALYRETFSARMQRVYGPFNMQVDLNAKVDPNVAIEVDGVLVTKYRAGKGPT